MKKSNDSYFCECALGYIGAKCERRRTCYISTECQPEYSHCVKSKMHNMALCACLPNPNGVYNRSYCDPIYDCSQANGLCLNGGTCVSSSQGFSCRCPDGYEGLVCEKVASWLSALFTAANHVDATRQIRHRPNLVIVLVVSFCTVLLIALMIISMVVFRSVKKARATRGTYSPSAQEMFDNSAGDILKPPPEERLI